MGLVVVVAAGVGYYRIATQDCLGGTYAAQLLHPVEVHTHGPVALGLPVILLFAGF
jgi:hypothetical protein